MSLVVYDRVQQTGSPNTTVSFTLSGTVIGYQTFAVVGNGNSTYYAATDASGRWEVGIGTYSTTGPTLTRNTIISSSNSNNAVTFDPAVNVFVTYPAEKSVNLDASGNVSALGNITSATWNATTVGVAYGGTGVTASSGSNSVVLRDVNQNIQVNNNFLGYTATTSAGTTTTLTAASTYYQKLTGTLAQTYQLPDATTLPNGATFIFDNDSTGNLTINDNTTALIDVVIPGSIDYIFVESNSTAAGSWGKYSYIPAVVNWGTSTADFGGTTISNATWNATTIATGYGGTGLTSFTANGAVYATSTSSLTTGTLPVVAGGTGVASLTTGYIPFGAGTSNLASTSNLTYSTTTNTLTAPYFNATGAVTANVAYGAFNNGNLGYSDTGIFGSFVTSQNSYGQWILQNSSSGNAASADYVVSNNLGANNAYYGDFGINSSTFAGAGSFSLPNAVYTYSSNGDMVVGTITGNNFRVVTNNSNTDAITVNITNSVAFNGSYGTSGFLLQSGASTAPPTWIAPANITAGAVTNTLTFTNAGNGAATGVSYNGSAAQVVSSNTILPAQTGNSGKYLTTDGANNVSWGSVAAALATGNNSILINNTNVTANGTVATGQNGFSVGPITTANGVSITIASGQKWVVI